MANGLIPGINMNWSSLFYQIMVWVGYLCLAIIVFAIILVIYYWFSYPIKLTYWNMFGSGKDGVFSFGKKRKNRVKWIKNRTSWKRLFPFFNKKEIEPFDSEYIYPGNQIYGFELNGELIPGRINIDKDENKIRAEINPVPYYIRNWQSFQHKKNAIEYAENNWWDQNKMFIYMLLAILFCCIMCVVTIYMSYQFATKGKLDLGKITEAIEKINVIPER